VESLVTAIASKAPGNVGGSQIISGPHGVSDGTPPGGVPGGPGGGHGLLGGGCPEAGCAGLAGPATASSSTGGCIADYCNGVTMPNKPFSYGWDCNGNGDGRVEGGGSAQWYAPAETPDNYDLGLVSSVIEGHGCQSNQAVCQMQVKWGANASVEADFGGASPLGTQVGNQQGTFNMSINPQFTADGVGASASIGATYNVYTGKIQGKLYDYNGNGHSTGYSTTWEHDSTPGCSHESQSFRNGAWWTFPYQDDGTDNAWSIDFWADLWYDPNQNG
jgi:hypothetical protein